MCPSTTMKQEDLPLNASLLHQREVRGISTEATIILCGNHIGFQQQYTWENLNYKQEKYHK